ncbi:hypothetical protein HK104_005428 [Borealophlyctis nickersoniae]|nr:hypothetical protein HK104_005428 [Borealophlyctis nickersoniae]
MVGIIPEEAHSIQRMMYQARLPLGKRRGRGMTHSGGPLLDHELERRNFEAMHSTPAPPSIVVEEAIMDEPTAEGDESLDTQGNHEGPPFENYDREEAEQLVDTHNTEDEPSQSAYDGQDEEMPEEPGIISHMIHRRKKQRRNSITHLTKPSKRLKSASSAITSPQVFIDATSQIGPSSPATAPGMLHDHLQSAVTSKKKPEIKRQKHVGKACVHCKKAHLACDQARPCKRCVHLGKTDCVDVEHKRRGRPRQSPEEKKAHEDARKAAAKVGKSKGGQEVVDQTGVVSSPSFGLDADEGQPMTVHVQDGGVLSYVTHPMDAEASRLVDDFPPAIPVAVE